MITEKKTVSIPRADRPEDVGVSSREILNFLKDIEANNLEFHSFMIIRHGKVAAESYRKPYTADRPHQMYSISKSFTSTAVGFAISEGYFTLDTKIMDLFPDYAEVISDKKTYEITIRHLLTMTAGKSTNLFADKGKIDWIYDFLNSGWYNDPGKEFRYTNENVYMLAAAVRRATGMTVRDYLQPRLFEPLGIDYPFWETDMTGTEAGGWGLYVKTEDLAKLMMCYANDGKFGDVQVLPPEFANQATIKQTENSNGQALDSDKGYGYLFWMNGGCENSYRADGMFSQFGIVMKDYDALFICTGSVALEQAARDAIWRHFPAAFLDESLGQKADDTYIPYLKTILKETSVARAVKSSRNENEKEIDGKTIKFRKNFFMNLVGFPVSVLPLAITYMTVDKAGNIDNVKLHFGDDECTMDWTEGDESNTVVCGMDGHYRYGTITLGQIEYTVCCNALWVNDSELDIHIRLIDTVGNRVLKFTFRSDGRVVMKPDSTPDVTTIVQFLAISLSEIVPIIRCKPIMKFINKISPIGHLLEPKQRGKITD